LSAFFFKSRSL